MASNRGEEPWGRTLRGPQSWLPVWQHDRIISRQCPKVSKTTFETVGLARAGESVTIRRRPSGSKPGRERLVRHANGSVFFHNPPASRMMGDGARVDWSVTAGGLVVAPIG
jgi:hypothetical protein